MRLPTPLKVLLTVAVAGPLGVGAASANAADSPLAGSPARPPVRISTEAGPPAGTVTAGPPGGTVAEAGPTAAAAAPARPFSVGTRQLALARGSDRPLPTTLWYPATGTPGADATPAAGRFPVVLLSHGLTSLPSDLAGFATRWAAAGFVVAGPAFPFTKRGAPVYDWSDMVNQPADGSYVIDRVLALDSSPGDPLAGHLSTDRVAAGGHSAGGYTTAGMLTSGRDDRLRAAIVLSGASLGGAWTGSPAPVLFVHGDADGTVPYASGRAAYTAVPWPKAFLTLTGGSHSGFLSPRGRGFEQVAATTTDFLRWTLYDDTAAQARLAADATAPAVSTWESTF